jgi:hypothetical protein
MATLTTTLSATAVGNSAAPNGWTSAPNSVLQLIGSANDSNFAEDTSNTAGTSQQTQGYALDDMPTGANTLFVSMNSVSIRMRYGWNATKPAARNWNSLQARVVNGATILAANDSGGAFEVVASSITNTTPTNSSTIAFTYVNTGASKATWDGAIVEMRIDTTRTGGGSAVARRVYALEVTGQYEALREVTVMKAWSGSAWVPGLLKRWNGATWGDALVDRWTGSAWVPEYGKD